MVNWEIVQDNTIADYIEDASYKVSDIYDTDFLDVSETISELSYLTHDYFRYYGKFPSKIAKYIINTLTTEKKIKQEQDFIFDNYNGSGTTMVEAKIAGFLSAGIDINPFGVLAANVKTYNYDVDLLKNIASTLFLKIKKRVEASEEQINFCFSDNVNGIDSQGIDDINKRIYLEFTDIDKWFDTDVIRQLSIIKHYVLSMPQDKYREFFSLGFFAIIRRVSRAHDAEVRPHINLKKRKRDAISAFEKKIDEMISTMSAWNTVTSKDIISQTEICDNSSCESVTTFIDKLKHNYNKNLGLVISHPPYLNP